MTLAFVFHPHRYPHHYLSLYPDPVTFNRSCQAQSYKPTLSAFRIRNWNTCSTLHHPDCQSCQVAPSRSSFTTPWHSHQCIRWKTSRHSQLDNPHRCVTKAQLIDSDSQGSSSQQVDPKPPSNLRKYSTLAFWAAFILYALFLAPGSKMDSTILDAIIANPVNPDINSIYFAVFSGLGLWPVIYIALLNPGAKDQKPPLLPFGFLSCFFGMFAMAPYLALRKYVSRPDPSNKSFALSITENQLFSSLTILFAIYCFALAFGVYDVPEQKSMSEVVFYSRLVDYLKVFKSNFLVHVSTLDFLAFWAFFPTVLVEDMKRRQFYSENSWSDKLLVLGISIVPLLGPACYLFLRDPLDMNTKRGKN